MNNFDLIKSINAAQITGALLAIAILLLIIVSKPTPKKIKE